MKQLLTDPLMLPIWLPMAAGFVCLLLPKAMEKIAGILSLVGSIVAAFLVWPLFKAGAGELTYRHLIHLRLDSLSGFILVATTGFGVLVSLYSLSYMKGKPRQREYYTYLLWTIGASAGALLAAEFILLLVFWGFLGITLYMMTGIAGPDASAAAKKSFIVIGASDSILIMGIAALWVLRGTTLMHADPVMFSQPLAYVAFISLAIAAFAKAGAMPFHSWVPDCGEKGPASVAAFLPASLDKLLGIYLLMRVSTDVFKMNGSMNTLLAVVGAATIILAAMMALVQHDLKRLLSYSAVSQVGYMVLGIGTGTAIGIAGGLFHMLNNAMYKSCLFLCAGSIEQKTGSSDLDKLGGLATAMPLTFFACVIAAMSISGIPPLNGFASKWMVYQGIVEMGKNGGALWIVWLTAAMLGSALTLASFVKLLHASFLRKPAPQVAERKVGEVSIVMWLPMVVLAVLCVVFGIFAYRLPLKHMILPAIAGNVAFIGTWWAGPATAMLILAFIVGIVAYLLGTVSKARVCDTYIGGEYLDKTYVSDEVAGARDVEVTGVDFYETIRSLQPLKATYKLAEKKVFDLYDVGTAVIFYFVEALRKAHNGVLPVYLTWFLVGLLAVAAVLSLGM